MINLQKVMDDISEIDTVEAIQRLINQGITPEQYKAAYTGTKANMGGIDLITQERQRQINQEGWTAEHDQQHENSELAIAAACYALEWTEAEESLKDAWPWSHEWDKRGKHGIIKRLSIAGALIAAEIDRILAKMQEELICHTCGSDEVYYENPRTGSGAYTCQDCGYILKNNEAGERL